MKYLIKNHPVRAEDRDTCARKSLTFLIQLMGLQNTVAISKGAGPLVVDGVSVKRVQYSARVYGRHFGDPEVKRFSVSIAVESRWQDETLLYWTPTKMQLKSTNELYEFDYEQGMANWNNLDLDGEVNALVGLACKRLAEDQLITKVAPLRVVTDIRDGNNRSIYFPALFQPTVYYQVTFRRTGHLVIGFVIEMVGKIEGILSSEGNWLFDTN